MRPMCIPAEDHFADNHDVIVEVGVLHMILTHHDYHMDLLQCIHVSLPLLRVNP